MMDDPADIMPELAGKTVSVVIWTTTPWTLPANLAIALHPDFDYAAVETPGGEVLILASELVESCMATFGIGDFTVLCTLKARQLEKKRCRHPLYQRESLIILGEHVTLEAGTGCVHTAPGHGREDYEVGLEYGLDAYSPVDDRGCFTEDVEQFAGQFVFKANTAIKEALADSGALLAAEKITHSYPHCWRCKQSVIFRATPQWFISMEKNGLRQACPDGHRSSEMDPPLGTRAHLRHDRKPSGLVCLAAAGMGRSHYCIYLQPVRGHPYDPRTHGQDPRPVQ